MPKIGYMYVQHKLCRLQKNSLPDAKFSSYLPPDTRDHLYAIYPIFKQATRLR